jgi:hypothetical protein
MIEYNINKIEDTNTEYILGKGAPYFDSKILVIKYINQLNSVKKQYDSTGKHELKYEYSYHKDTETNKWYIKWKFKNPYYKQIIIEI